ncbi:hypothetical protein VNO80_33791 [Phaseolus coccineus]|uniref:Uncharacterized protein n=1 Tax=Phaseolus coccineus TaxID=3886 RepID=A0AAN9KZA2_PHACN
METGALFDRACLRYLPSGLDRIKSFVVRKGFNPAAGVGPQASELALQKKLRRWRALCPKHVSERILESDSGERCIFGYSNQYGSGLKSDDFTAISIDVLKA